MARARKIASLAATAFLAALAGCAARGATTPPSPVPPIAPLLDLQGCLLRSWAPTVPAAHRSLLPVERDLFQVAERTRAGRFREAAQILDDLDRSTDAGSRLESLLFREELEDFRLAYIGGGSGTGEARIDAVRRQAARRKANDSINALLATLPPAERREANLAVQLESTMSLAADLPALAGFQMDHAALNDGPAIDIARFRANLDETVARLRATPGVHPALEAWYAPVRAWVDLREGNSQAAVDALLRSLASTDDRHVRAELHLRLGDAQASPFGPVEMLGQNPLSLDDATNAMRASTLTRSLVAPSNDARRRAAAEYDAAAAEGVADLDWGLGERRAYLESFEDRPRAAAMYRTAAAQAKARGMARDTLRLETIAALLARDVPELARVASEWARDEDVGGRRSMVALACWYAVWLADVVVDPDAARRMLEAVHESLGAAHLDKDVVGLRQFLAIIDADIGLLDAATRFDESAAAAERTIVADAEQVERDIPGAEGQARIANTDLAVILQSLANRLGLLGISDHSEVLQSRQKALEDELMQRWGKTGLGDAIRKTEQDLVDQMRAIADRRRRLESVHTCAQRAELLRPRMEASSGLGRAELLVVVASCRPDWGAQARGLLDKLDPVGAFEATLAKRGPDASLVARNEVDSAGVDLARALRAAAAAADWTTVARWAERLEGLVGRDRSLDRYRRYASLYRAVALLHGGAVSEALRRLEALRAEGSLAVDSEVELGVYASMAQAYVAQGDALRGLWAETMSRMRRHETDELANGLRPGDPSGAEQAALERKFALTGALDDSDSRRLDDLQRAARATAVANNRYPSIADVSSLVEHLPQRTVVEVVDISGREAMVWCARQGSLGARKLPQGGDHWAAEVGAFRAGLANGNSDPGRARHLFDGLLDSCALRDGEGLVLLGVRGPLEHAIERDGEEVIERRTVVHAEELWEPQPVRGSNALGAFVLGVNSNGLRLAEAEAKNVAGVLGVTPATPKEDSALFGPLEAARYVHIAADGQVDPDNPYASNLSLGADRHIAAWELFQHASRAHLVTLSACDTASLVPRTRGYSFATLAHLAGARWVIASDWQVGDAATDAFMRDFYQRAIEEHATIPDAFRAAKRRTKAAYAADPKAYAPYSLSVRSVVAAAE